MAVLPLRNLLIATLVVVTARFVVMPSYLLLVGKDKMSGTNSNATAYNPYSNVRPLVPRMLPNEELQEQEGEGKNRFDLPAARLVGLSSNSLEKTFSIQLSQLPYSLQEFLNEDSVSYIAISSVKYEFSDNQSIELATLLMTHKAASLEYSTDGQTSTSDGFRFIRTVKLAGNIDAVAFSNPEALKIKNQIVFIRDKQYYITVDSTLPLETLVDIVNKHLVMQ